MVKKTVHEKLNKNKLKNIESNAAKFASIINKKPILSNVQKNVQKNGILGINLDANRFSELASMDGRFWDTNSNANKSAGKNDENEENDDVQKFKPAKNTKNNGFYFCNIGDHWFRITINQSRYRKQY